METEKEVISQNHITIYVHDNSDLKIEWLETPKALKDGGITVDDLKESNLRTNDKPHLIYMSSSLAPKEENQYFELLSNYKDVFT